MNKAAIVIVTYNARKYIEPLFASLNRLGGDFKVFVVDNASQDGTAEEARNYTKYACPKCHINGRQAKLQKCERKSDPSGQRPVIRNMNMEIIENRENLGFAAGNNVGMRQALDEGFEYIVLLNQDMELDEGWLLELVRKAESDDKIGVVQAMMLLAWDRDRINATGERLNYLGIGHSGNYQLPIASYHQEKNIISYASGASVLYKRQVLEQVGLLDESFFMYSEDADLSFRARLGGFGVALADKAKCWHDYRFNKNPKTYYWTEKNRLALLIKNFELKTLLLIFPMFVVMEFGMLAYSIATGWFLYKLKSYGWVFKNLGQILKSRRKIQKTRKVKDKELKKYLVAGIEFGGMENWVLKYLANPAMRGYWWLIKKLI